MGSLNVSKAIGRLAVDCNAVIAYREGIAEVCRRIEEAELLFMPIVVLGELLYGAKNSGRSTENEQAVRLFFEHCVPVNTDEDVATRYASLRRELKSVGRPIPENDIWIAAACLEVDSALLSNDGHFSGITSLTVINWV